MYKFEIHLHTNNCSACAVSSPQEMVDAAVEHGYSGIVITNHFYNGNSAIDRALPWEQFVDAYKRDYETARAYGEKQGIQVFFGIEEGFAPGKEMLIYGVTPEQIADNPRFVKMTLKEKSDFIHKCGGLCICAHPFRNRAYIPDPDTPPDADCFDGIEGFNLCNPSEENEKAFVFALNNKMLITSGSDVHKAANFGKAGIAFSKPVKSYGDFLKRLKKGDFRLITPFETSEM